VTRLDGNSSEPALKEWRDYRQAPGPSTFGPLVGVIKDEGDMRAIQIAMQRLYWESEDWKVAQHLAMLLSGSKAHFAKWPSDQLLASYFAAYARANSSNSPLAHLVEARIFWERRLCPAALHNLARMAKAPHFEQLRNQILVEYWTLHALCNAYLGWPDEAWKTMRGHLTNEAETLFQLLWSLDAGNPILDELTPMLRPLMDDLIPQHLALLRKHWQLRLLNILRHDRDQR